MSADIHDRMPVWLLVSQMDKWTAANPGNAMAMLLASLPAADGVVELRRHKVEAGD